MPCNPLQVCILEVTDRITGIPLMPDSVQKKL